MFSPKLFPPYLESISQKMSWEETEVIINGESFMVYCLFYGNHQINYKNAKLFK